MIKKVFFVSLGLIGLATAAAVYAILKGPEAFLTSPDFTFSGCGRPDK